ncbi:lipocalin family protein [Pinibacter soli]|uniref:Lipocalin family protein n=1 Tax=Pinibacter soli TaxID=3044211 RepID=A0ABT6RAU0_9BACT|nr:lipocalin family protein [Pinibacter soli]MDI3319660.1 lipocalin family protein [Pinibacter soli]
MKNIIGVLFLALIFMSACNNASQSKNEGKDTIAAVKAKKVNPDAGKFIGAWICQKPGKVGQVEGFKLKEDSVAESINTPTLDYKKWWLAGDTLVFVIESNMGNAPATMVRDTMIALNVSSDSLVTTTMPKRSVRTIYRKQNMPNVALTDAKWKLTRMDGTLISDSAYIQFDTTGLKFTGYGGCNFIRGNYKTGIASLRMNHLASTKKMCAPEINAVETKLFAYIQSTNNYFIVGDELQLREGAKTLAIFKAMGK